MDAQGILRQARAKAGVSQRELAERAKTSPSAVAAYESGAKSPTVTTLNRLLVALGAELQFVSSAPAGFDRVQRGDDLEQLLDLAESFPHQSRGELTYPVFRRR